MPEFEPVHKRGKKVAKPIGPVVSLYGSGILLAG
jgi:hypothetical protein